jgi:hypothetical protein
VPFDSRCNAILESGKYRQGVVRGFIVRVMSGFAGTIRGDRDTAKHRGPLVAVLSAALLAACSPGTPTAPSLAPTDIAYRTPNPARPHFALAEMASLTQMSDRQLMQRLGSPDFTRRDPPAEIWQYRSASCVLDVFLYPEADGLKVLHATTRDRTKLGTPDDGCTPFPDQRSASAQ